MCELIGGLISLIWVLIIFWAVVRTVQSTAPTGAKVVWILVLIFFPVFGLIMWLLVGPRRSGVP